MYYNYDNIFKGEGINYFKKFETDELDLAIEYLENIKLDNSKEYNSPIRIIDVLIDYQNSLNSFLNCFDFYTIFDSPFRLESDYKFNSPQYFHDYILSFTFLKIIDTLLVSDKRFNNILIKNNSKWNLKSLIYSHLIFDNLESINKELFINFKNYIEGFDEKIRDILNGFNLNLILDFLNENNLLLSFVIGIYIVDLNEIVFKTSNNLQKFYFSFIKNFRYNKFFYSNGYNKIFKLSERPNFTLSFLPKLLLSKIDISNFDELTIYDPSCDDGDLLLECKKFINNINPNCNVILMGCSISNPRSFSLCLSKMLFLNQDLNNFSYSNDFNSQFKSDLFINNMFDFIISDFGHIDYFLNESSFNFVFSMEELCKKFKIKSVIIYSFSLFNIILNSWTSYDQMKYFDSLIRIPISSKFGRDGILVLNKVKSKKLENKFLLIDESVNRLDFNLNNLPKSIMKNILKCYLNFKEYDNGKIFDLYDIVVFFNFKILMYDVNKNEVEFNVPVYPLGLIVYFGSFSINYNHHDLIIPSKSYNLEKNVYFEIDKDTYKNHVSFNVNSDIVLKDYLYYYLNSNKGTSDILYFIKDVEWITDNDLFHIPIPVPSIEEQVEIVNAARKMESFFNAMDIWKNNYSNNILNYKNTLDSYEDFACSVEFSENGSIDMCPRWKIVYQGLIWPLATAYLKATMESDKESIRKKNHIVFFEFLASFNVIILISAIKSSTENIGEYDKIMDELWSLKVIKTKSGITHDYTSWHGMTFGSWTTLYGNLYKIFKNYKFSTVMDRGFFENLASKKYKKLFNKLRIKERNADSHGGFVDDFDESIKLQELERYMDEDMFDILKLYSGLKLFYTVGPNYPISPEKTKYTIIHLNGPCDPPHRGKITTNIQLNHESLYFYDYLNNNFLELDSDLIKFRLIPNSKKYGIYIYDGIDLKENVALYKCYYDKERWKIPLKTDEDTFLKVSDEFLKYALRI